MQVLEQAITATKSLNDDTLSEYIHKQRLQNDRRRDSLQRDRRMGKAAIANGAISKRARKRA